MKSLTSKKESLLVRRSRQSLAFLLVVLTVVTGLGQPFVAPKEVHAVYTGKSLRTVEFVLGAGAGSAVSQTGTDANNSNPRATDLNVYAGTSWNATKATAGRKSLVIPGTGIRVLSAYVDFTSQITSSAIITDVELALDVGQGMASGTDYDLNAVFENIQNAFIWRSTSGIGGNISAKADATMLFQHQTDANWNAGVSVVGQASVKGPSWNMATMKLIITYEEDYSVTPHTALKTVRFPLRSTTAGDNGTKAIDCPVSTCSFNYTLDLPDLATTSDIMDAWFEVHYNDDATATATISINGGAAGVAHKALPAVTSNHEHFIVYRPLIGSPNFATGTVGQLDVAVAGTLIGALGGEVLITYKYNTSAPIQIETVRYFMGQVLTAQGVASTTYNKIATISNAGVVPSNVWFKYTAANYGPLLFSATAKVGESASSTFRATSTMTNIMTGNTTYIFDVGNATTSWSGASSALITSFAESDAAFDSLTSVEAFVTFRWNGSGGGNVTKTGTFFAGNSPVAHGDATFDTVFPYTIILPETVTKTLRSSYVRSAFTHSQVTNVTTGTIIMKANGSGTTTYTQNLLTPDIESYRSTIFIESTTTDFTTGNIITRTNYPMVFSARGSQTNEEYTFDNEHVVTYDAALEGFPTINFLHYRWRVDNENEVSAGFYAAEDTALANATFIGDRVRLRTTIFNSGVGTATDYKYRLQYASSSCTSWYDLGANVEWYADQSQYFTDYASTTDNAGLSNPAGTFLSGVIRHGTSTTGKYTLAPNYFTEHEYTINSSYLAVIGTPYCFRITNDGSITYFVYSVQPQITSKNATSPSKGGPGGIEADGGGTQRTGGGQGGGSGSEGGGGGNPVGGGGPGGGGDSG